jgi:hypothetical protein
MDGEVGRLDEGSRCNAILCPPGTSSSFGKETAESTCTECAENTDLYGQVGCGETDGEQFWEKAILDKFFSMTGGRYWNRAHANWLKPGVPICQREGVGCFNPDDNFGVRELDMNAFGLRGTVPNDIWKLTDARLFSFTDNPVDVTFDGIEQATSLIVLKLSNCHLRTLDGLGNVSKKLLELHLARNQFNGTIPDDIFELDQLKEIYLNNNHFGGRIPTNIGKMIGLTELEIWNNRLTGVLPSEIGLLTNLATLSVSQNELSGAIPVEIQSLAQLAKLELAQQRGSKFDGPLPAFDQNPALVSIDASQNGFSGWLPPTFLAQVDGDEKVTVNLSQNLFEGPLPEAWSKFENLSIDLSGNMLTGLPETLCASNGWNNGLVGLLATCDAILCPPGTYSLDGRQIQATETCSPCSGGKDSAPYFGARECMDPRISGENQILTDFYGETNGDSWLVQRNWLSNNPVCTWYGVICNEGNFVEELSLENNFLKSGSTSAASNIFALSDLKVEAIAENTFPPWHP